MVTWRIVVLAIGVFMLHDNGVNPAELRDGDASQMPRQLQRLPEHGVQPTEHHSYRCEERRPLGPVGPHKELDCTALSFRLQNLRRDIRAECGVFKCFYRNKQTYRHSHHPEVGFIVQPYTTEKKQNPALRPGEPSAAAPGEVMYPNAHKSGGGCVHSACRRWILQELAPFAEKLATSYHIKHGLMGPPLVIDISKRFAEALGALAYPSAKNLESPRELHLRQKMGTAAFLEAFHKDARSQFSAGSLQLGDHGKRYWSVLVQQTYAAPKNAVFLRCDDEDLPQLDAVVAASRNETVLRNLHQNLVATVHMVAGQPCLANDFQAMLAPDTGDVYQIDLDRCYTTVQTRRWIETVERNKTEEYAAKCLQKLRLLGQHTLAKLDELDRRRDVRRSLDRAGGLHGAGGIDKVAS